MHISTRASSPQDLSILWNIYVDAMKAHITAIWGWDESWQRRDFSLEFANSITCLIEMNNVLSGYFQIESGERNNYLKMFILAPEARSKGTGARILTEIIKKSQQNGKHLILSVFKINHAAKRFYEREGWIVIDEDASFYQMCHLNYINNTVISPSSINELQSYSSISISV